MIAEAIAKVQELVEFQTKPQLLHQDNFQDVYYNPATRQEFRITRNVDLGRKHCFSTLEGFLSYLNSEHTAEDRGIVFISRQKVFVRFNYGLYLSPAVAVSSIMLPIEETDAFRAFRTLDRGLTQKEAWKLMATDLDGCCDDSLLMSLRSVQVKNDSKVEWNIDEIGGGSGGATGGISVTTGKPDGSSTGARFKEEYFFNIQPWRCFNHAYEIKTRLVIDTDQGLKFFWYPARLEEVLDRAANDFAEAIRMGLSDETKKRFTVHEGTYAGNS